MYLQFEIYRSFSLMDRILLMIFVDTACCPKKPKYTPSTSFSTHPSYPFPIPHLPSSITDHLGFAPASEGQFINDQTDLDLDLIYYQPYIPAAAQTALFSFLRQELPFYRVHYAIDRGRISTQITTPRYTTVFGTSLPVGNTRYKCTPRPLPFCLDELRKIIEATTGQTFNFCLGNYYADGQDSISYHSDDERFLGPDPAIASLSFGAKRDFLIKHKPIPPPDSRWRSGPEPKQIKLALYSGDMLLIKGRTQANWLHSVPKRAGVDGQMGRINVTFRKAVVKAGTENYYTYNVGKGDVFRWNEDGGRMVPWGKREVWARGEGV
ncbi:hypothetical protein CC78DRAFT_556336 [Lojkania enalia]|uniref:Fe2OG dioxygenase domain-containing protein n=1 Tax=Lojkania enalia TaxID=147567 RepID=A0A9P4JX69_9PLEO|nr:hypothetical protein CC78DRAFT_556336 [Didymosphaeria enalia]